jgi:hypothetical protein
VNMTDMLNNCGMDCNSYSTTLIDWQSNNPAVTERTLGAVGLQYGIYAETAREALIFMQGWIITGDFLSGTDCSNIQQKSFSVSVGREDKNEIFTEEKAIVISPNPATSRITINSEEEQLIYVFNNYGIVVRKLKIESGDNQFDISALPSGLYLFRADKNENVIKVIKQ